jgi:aminopeptidase
MDILDKYAQLLTKYCLDIQPGERLLISTTTLAEPLVREVYRWATRLGATVEVDFSFREQSRIFLHEANEEQLKTVSPFFKMAMEEFETYLAIRAPYNLRETQMCRLINPRSAKKPISP